MEATYRMVEMSSLSVISCRYMGDSRSYIFGWSDTRCRVDPCNALHGYTQVDSIAPAEGVSCMCQRQSHIAVPRRLWYEELNRE
ncbi:MAG: hypothetical protein STSR0009_04710 [Methanoregula sp.]